MDAEVKTKWVVALRSGEFVQGQTVLKYNAGGQIKHCCLGVLCEIMGVTFTPQGEPYGFMAEYKNEHRVCLVPSTLLEEIGLNGGYMGELTAMNDAYGRYHGNPQSFLQIADWIEANL